FGSRRGTWTGRRGSVRQKDGWQLRRAGRARGLSRNEKSEFDSDFSFELAARTRTPSGRRGRAAADVQVLAAFDARCVKVDKRRRPRLAPGPLLTHRTDN